MKLTQSDFRWDGDFWKTELPAPKWSEWLRPVNLSAALAALLPPMEKLQVVFAPEGRGEEALSPTEIALVQYFVDRQDEILKSAITSVFDNYQNMRDTYGFDDEEGAELMPEITRVEDLKSLIGLSSLNVHPLSLEGKPYLGFEFGCTWDREHGLGVLMHGRRFVQIGGADTAILLWIAERDRDEREGHG